jgi:cell division transport system ATP-binding protein
MIRITHVSMIYPGKVVVLADINLEISSGEFAFIHGASSAGRTTLLRILFGAERPTSGEVVVNGMNITRKGFNKLHQLRRTMGIIFQDFKLLRDRTVSENIAFPLEVTGHSRKEVKRRVPEVLEKIGLQEREKHPILALSAGEQQRVAIARALINDPRLLLADEPTGNLDAQMTGDVMEIFNDLHLEGTTIVFATHNTELIGRYPHRVISLSGGKEVDGKIDEKVRAGE